MCTKAPEFCSRKCAAQARLMLKEPLRWTSSTSCQSLWLMRWKIASRRMPALFTRMSTRPKVSTAVLTIASAFFASEIDSVEAIASPPAFLISSTTSCAGPASVPAPCRLAPMSQATTLAPSCARPSAMPRPIPRAAPVTIATFPETMPAHVLCLVELFRSSVSRPRDESRTSSWRDRLPLHRGTEFGKMVESPDFAGMTSRDDSGTDAPTTSSDNSTIIRASPIARPRRGYCLPRSRRSRIAATGRAGRCRRISPPPRCGA